MLVFLAAGATGAEVAGEGLCWGGDAGADLLEKVFAGLERQVMELRERVFAWLELEEPERGLHHHVRRACGRRAAAA